MNGSSTRERAVRKVLWTILVLNWVVAAAKLAYGAYSGSVAISADGIHSFADGASNIVALIALFVAAMPPDEGHPYGHRKFEVLGSLGIGIMIVVGMAGIAWRTFHGDRPQLLIGAGGFSVVVGTLVVNIFVAAYEARLGRRLQSPLLEADARHTASDVMATLAVLTAFIAEHLGVKGGDRAAAIFIMALIGMASFDIFRTAIRVLVDAAHLDPGNIVAETLVVEGVVACHKARSRGVPGEILVDLHVQVDPNISVAEGHHIAHRVQRALRAKFPEVIEVHVHTEPASARQIEEYELRRSGTEIVTGELAPTGKE